MAIQANAQLLDAGGGASPATAGTRVEAWERQADSSGDYMIGWGYTDASGDVNIQYDEDGIPISDIDPLDGEPRDLYFRVVADPGGGQFEVTQDVPESAVPTGVDLLLDSDTGISNRDYITCLNNAPGKALQFNVTGTVLGATVTLYWDGQPIGSALATGTTTTITTNETVPLTDGANLITARQTEPDKLESIGSPGVNIIVDATAPAAVVASAPDITSAGGTTYDFSVTFADSMGVDVSDLDLSDVRVLGPYDYSQLATLDGVTGTTGGTFCTAFYHITAPSWTWDEMDDGTYTVVMQADQVADIAGNFTPGGNLGYFTVDIEGADILDSCVLTSDTTLDLYLGFDTWQFVDDDGGQVIVVPGFDQTGDPGEPLLPEASIFLGLPANTDPDSLVLSILGSTQSAIPGTFGIAPGLPAGTIETDGDTIISWGEGKQIVNGRDILVYENDAFYGAPTVRLLSGAQMGKWKIAEIVYDPFEYNPVTGSLRVTNDIGLRISFEVDPLFSDRLELDTLADSDAARLLDNYQQASAWYPEAAVADRAATLKPGYVILTTSTIQSNLKQLDAFVKQKELLGYSVSVVTENSGGPDNKGWGGGTGDAASEKIRDWFKANYDAKHMNIQYAMLIGNPDPSSGDVPMKMTYPNTNSFRTFSNSTPVTILADNTVSSTLSVTDVLNINDITVTVDITYSKDSDLSVWLQSPSGASVVLFSGVGGTSGNFTSTTLDGLATTAITSGSVLAPFTGRFRPAGDLSDFFDTKTNGTWTLRIANSSDATQGTLNNWSITVVPDYCKSPTDYYYANVTEDWDKNKDLRYGEWGATYDFASAPTTQIAVGRIPIYAANYSAGDAILSKTVAYEVSQDRTWRKNILLPAAIWNYENENDRGQDRADAQGFTSAIKTNAADPAGWTTVRMAELVGLTPVTAGAGVLAIGGAGPDYNSNVVTQWGSNKYGFVTWSGHGSQTGVYRKIWVTNTAGDSIPRSSEIAEEPYFMNTDAPSLNNSYPSFVMEVSCNNAWPENPDNMAYSLLKNGAVATVAATRVSWYYIGSWTTSVADSYGDNNGFGYYLTKYMLAYPTAGVGTALNWVRSKLGTGWRGQSLMNLMDHNVYGDPSLGLNTGVSKPLAIKANTQLRQAGGAVTPVAAGTRVEAWERQADSSGDYMIGWANTDASGNVTIEYDEDGIPISDVDPLDGEARNVYFQVVADPGGGQFEVTQDLEESVVPTGVDLLLDSDTGVSNRDYITSFNNSSGKALQFNVTGTVLGAMVTLYWDGQPMGSALATGTTTTITTNETLSLPDGTDLITARQTEPDKLESAASPGLNIVVDTTGPSAVLDARSITTTGGGATYGFAVAFSDNLLLNVGSLDNLDFLVTGPNGYSQMAVFDGVVPAGNGTPRTASYHITAPGGTWDLADVGAYSVALQSNQVNDVAGNAAAGGTWSTFTVASVFVDDDFTSATPGWNVDHFAQIQDGVAAVPAGGLVVVAPGVYNEIVTLNKDATVTLTGAETVGSFMISGGTVGASSCNLRILNDYSQSGGTFVSVPTLGSFTVAGSFSLAGGVFNRFTGSGTTTGDPYLIYDVYGLQAMKLNLGAGYKLANDVDASSMTNWNGGAGFAPVGDGAGAFGGSLDGDNKSITGLYINRPSQNYVGLFGFAGAGTSLTNIGLIGGGVTGNSYVGGLVGLSAATIANCYATGSVSGNSFIGGLLGQTQNATVSFCHAAGPVSGVSYVGGAVGLNFDTVTNSYATGAVTGSGYCVGGFVGESGSLSKCYATGSVIGGFSVGGLVGHLVDYSSPSVVSDSYATGAVTCVTAYAGGLVGSLYGYYGSRVYNSYAVGSVNGSLCVGGLVGGNYQGAVTSSYWDTQTTGQSSSAVGTGKTTAEMKQQATFSGWDFANTWGIVAGASYPYLKWMYPSGVSVVSGTAYTDQGTTTVAGGATVTVANNGSVLGSAMTGANGAYYFASDASAIAGGDKILAYLDNNATKADTVTMASGATITGLDLYGDTLIVRSESVTAMTNALLSAAKGGLTDTDMFYTVAGNNFALDPSRDLLVWASKTYNPGGSVTARDFSMQTGASFTSDPTTTTFTATRSFSLPTTGTFNRFTGSGTTTGDPYMIYDVYGLQAMALNVSAGYMLANNIDASSTINWNGGLGFAPVGNTGAGAAFAGSLNGNNYTITSLYINRGAQNCVGLFGAATNGSSFTNVGLVGETVVGSAYCGGLTGYLASGTVYNCYVTGGVTGGTWVGGLVGMSFYGGVSNCSATVNVNGVGYVGGLVGEMYGGTVSGSNAAGTAGGPGGQCVGGLVGFAYYGAISQSNSTANATGAAYVGGLVGELYGGTASSSYATGNAGGGSVVGGFVGYSYYGTVSKSYATGGVIGNDYVGGLAGELYGGTASNTYATGSVSGVADVGGLVGYNYYGTVSNGYAAGWVSGSNNVGGLVGARTGATQVFSSYWDMWATGQGSSAGGAGRTTAQMCQQATFIGWDFINTWSIVQGVSYPYLQGVSTQSDMALWGGVSRTFQDADGTTIALALVGPGSGFFTLTNGQTTGAPIDSIILNNTTDGTYVLVSSFGGAVPGATFRNLVINGAPGAAAALGMFYDSGLSLAPGGRIQSSNGINWLMLGDVGANSNIGIQGSLGMFSAGVVGANVVVNVAGTLSSFTVTSVGAGSQIAAGAGGIGMMTIGGNADMTVNTAGPLGSLVLWGWGARLSGNLNVGSLGTLMGWATDLNNLNVVSAGGINTVFARSATNTNMTAGAGIGTVYALGGGFAGSLTANGLQGITTVMIRGNGNLNVTTPGPLGCLMLTGLGSTLSGNLNVGSLGWLMGWATDLNNLNVVSAGGINAIYARSATNTNMTAGAGIATLFMLSGGYTGRIQADGAAGIGTMYLTGASNVDVKVPNGPVGTVMVMGGWWGPPLTLSGRWDVKSLNWLYGPMVALNNLTIRATDGLGTMNVRSMSNTTVSAGFMGSLTVTNNVTSCLLLTGYDIGEDLLFGSGDDAAFTSGAATGDVGSVWIGGNMSGTTLAANVRPGADGVFGTADDVLVSASLQGAISSLTVGGTLTGSGNPGQHYGVVSRRPLGPVTVGGVLLAPGWTLGNIRLAGSIA